MYSKVTVIPADNFISVDGQPLFFEYTAPTNLHALQWHNGSGHMEWTGSANTELKLDDYKASVLPYILLWEAENTRLAKEIDRPPTPEEQLAIFTAVIQHHLDSFALTRNYDSILSASTYATSTNPKFHTEGQYAVKARDLTWAKAYAIFDDVLSGVRLMPTTEEIIADLPPLEWPELAT